MQCVVMQLSVVFVFNAKMYLFISRRRRPKSPSCYRIGNFGSNDQKEVP